jgi:cytochrome bd-type quinol oxidase subunit 2
MKRKSYKEESKRKDKIDFFFFWHTQMYFFEWIENPILYHNPLFLICLCTFISFSWDSLSLFYLILTIVNIVLISFTFQSNKKQNVTFCTSFSLLCLFFLLFLSIHPFIIPSLFFWLFKYYFSFIYKQNLTF